jgi:hypothetical protein
MSMLRWCILLLFADKHLIVDLLVQMPKRESRAGWEKKRQTSVIVFTMYTRIYCVLYCLYCVFVLLLLCVFILICY